MVKSYRSWTGKDKVRTTIYLEGWIAIYVRMDQNFNLSDYVNRSLGKHIKENNKNSDALKKVFAQTQFTYLKIMIRDKIKIGFKGSDFTLIHQNLLDWFHAVREEKFPFLDGDPEQILIDVYKETEIWELVKTWGKPAYIIVGWEEQWEKDKQLLKGV